MRYVPWAISRVEPTGSAPPKPAYAPESPTMRHRRPLMTPSLLSPSSTYCTCPRPCIVIRFSSRVSTQETGRPSDRAAASATTFSAATPALPPNAPPTCGATTRRRWTSRPRMPAAFCANPCGICVETCTVRSWPRPSGRGARRERALGVGGSRQRVEVEAHERRSIVRLRHGLGDDHRDRLADEADLPVGEGRPPAVVVEHHERVEGADAVFREVGGGEYGDHSRLPRRLGGVDAEDPRVGHR